jgi:hypothetical protein
MSNRLTKHRKVFQSAEEHNGNNRKQSFHINPGTTFVSKHRIQSNGLRKGKSK